MTIAIRDLEASKDFITVSKYLKSLTREDFKNTEPHITFHPHTETHAAQFVITIGYPSTENLTPLVTFKKRLHDALGGDGIAEPNLNTYEDSVKFIVRGTPATLAKLIAKHNPDRPPSSVIER